LRSVLLLLVAIGCGGPEEAPLPEPDPASERTLGSGRVVGFENDDGVHVWRGLPFARPPLGALRWRAPRPPEPWEGVREALAFGEPCTQFAMGLGDGEEGALVGSEDCLVANVFAPRFEPDAVPSGDARLPVMVWIHGGGNSIGSAEIYDLGRLARSQGVVAVAVHYRLGVMGWFRHPALHAADESADDRSGNYGTLDLVRALEWVRDEIGAFGGDPGNVTVFGESAGGVNVFSLLLSPRAEGLFDRSISQSGILATRTGAEAENYADDPGAPGHRHSSRELAVDLLARRQGIERAAARSALDVAGPAAVEELMRGASTEELYAPFEDTRLGGMIDAPFVLRDGHVIPKGDPLAVFAAGGGAEVPVILGSNRDENKLFLLFSDESVTRWFGLPMWLSDARRFELFSGYLSRLWKASGVDAPARALARAGRAPVWGYRFDWDEQPRVLFADYSVLLGAAHAMEVPFVLGHLDLGRANRFLFDEERRPAAERLSRAMMSYWGRFAHAGDPGRGAEGTLPAWRPWGPIDSGPGFLVLDTGADGGIRMSDAEESLPALVQAIETDPRFESTRERCELFAQYTGWSPDFPPARYATVAGGACREFEIASFPNVQR